MKIVKLDIRDVSIIDALPAYDVQPLILNVGCGKGRIDTWLSQNGYVVYATDYEIKEGWVGSRNLIFFEISYFFGFKVILIGLVFKQYLTFKEVATWEVG